MEFPCPANEVGGDRRWGWLRAAGRPQWHLAKGLLLRIGPSSWDPTWISYRIDPPVHGQQQLLASLHMNSPSNYQHRLRSLFNVKPIVEEAASLPSKEGSRHLSPPLASPGFCGASNTTLVCISATGRDCRRASGLEHHTVLLYKHIIRLL